MCNSEISSEILLNLFNYKDGNIYWKQWKKGRSRNLIAGTINNKGYLKVTIDGKQMYAHRIVWIMHNGNIDDGYEIDHINHNRSDNRIENLRIVTRSENAKNLSMAANNKTGFTDVFFNKKRNKYFSSVKVGNNHIFGGWHDSIESAVTSRNALWKKFGFHQNHGAEK
ncbi:HNH endonuclease [Salmonella phage FSL SP-126]|uniref:EndY n=1 Tax=Salmonella phage FSL SP-126 TaxID=2928681 RepID=S4TSA2_9CAUD|nr:HNH endonuclease [Salmonella phage FSL SP-126]AGF87895.1 EndY [Salmonella phage FSL SP-126]EME1300551.1 HNH endonuclease [Salmonella enterica subsp. enterica serovar Kentucky]